MPSMYEYKDNFKKIQNIKTEKLYGCHISNLEPLISFVVPTYKRSKYLQQALDSIYNQTEDGINYEIVVVNNDPENDMYDIIERNKRDNIYFYRNTENIGMVGNLNRCAELSRGKYVAYLHDDDLLEPNYLCEIKKVLLHKHYAQYDCIIPNNQKFFEGGRVDEDSKKYLKAICSVLFFYRYLYRTNISTLKEEDFIISWNRHFYIGPTCGTLFKREKLMKSGGFNDEFYPSPDLAFFIKYNSENKICIVRKKLAKYRCAVNGSYRQEVKVGFILKRIQLINENHRSKMANVFLKTFKNELIYGRYSDIADEIDEETRVELLENYDIKNALEEYTQLKMILRKIISKAYIYLKNYDCFW